MQTLQKLRFFYFNGTGVFLPARKNGSLHRQEVSAGVDVLPHVELLPGGDHRGPRDQLYGPGGGLVPHVVGHRCPHHSFHLGQNVAQVLEQEHLRLGESRSAW